MSCPVWGWSCSHLPGLPLLLHSQPGLEVSINGKTPCSSHVLAALPGMGYFNRGSSSTEITITPQQWLSGARSNLNNHSIASPLLTGPLFLVASPWRAGGREWRRRGRKGRREGRKERWENVQVGCTSPQEAPCSLRDLSLKKDHLAFCLIPVCICVGAGGVRTLKSHNNPNVCLSTSPKSFPFPLLLLMLLLLLLPGTAPIAWAWSAGLPVSLLPLVPPPGTWPPSSSSFLHLLPHQPAMTCRQAQLLGEGEKKKAEKEGGWGAEEGSSWARGCLI
jgi:hypothetical protein